MNNKIWNSMFVVERSLQLDEVTEMFTSGNMMQESVQARYKWMSDIVHLKASDEVELPLKDIPTGEKECKQFRVVFEEHHAMAEEQKSRKAEQKLLMSGFRDRFQKSQVPGEAETTFNLRTGFRQPEMEERRRDMEIEGARKRHDLYENTAKALYDWYARLDVSGDGHMDFEEFAVFLRGIVQTYGLSLDDIQVKRHWRELRSNCGSSIGFTQFVNYLLYKFPHVRYMTAFEVKKFEEKSAKSLKEEAARKRDSMNALKAFKKSLLDRTDEIDREREQRDSDQLVNDPGISYQVVDTGPVSLVRPAPQHPLQELPQEISNEAEEKPPEAASPAPEEDGSKLHDSVCANNTIGIANHIMD